MTLLGNCKACGKPVLDQLIDFGPQAVCHHFLKSTSEKDDFHDLVLGQCRSCGTVQLTQYIPIENMVPRYDWLTCTEPELHLDRLAETITRLPGITKDSKIGGLSFKDDSTLNRFKNLGYTNIWRADLCSELGVTDPNAGIESVQATFHSQSADRLIEHHGTSDVFIARHILEHAYDLKNFIAMCKRMLKPEGYVVFEIPDCERALEKYDYTTIWEQHTVYFTGETFRNCFNLNGLSVVHFEKVPYSIEDSYIGIAQIDDTVHLSILSEGDLREEIQRGKMFAEEYMPAKAKLKKYFQEYQRERGKMAIFGAGHMSCVYLNLFGLSEYFEFVVDDNPNMRGLFMPGSKLPILGSAAVYERDIKMCLLTLSAISEEKVIKNNQKFLDQGGEFLSVFPGSPWAMGETIKA